MKKNTSTKGASAGTRGAPARITAPRDWRADLLARLRKLIQQAIPDVVEEVKWRKPSNPAGVPVWSHNGILCTGETYKDKVKLTFAQGAALDDPLQLRTRRRHAPGDRPARGRRTRRSSVQGPRARRRGAEHGLSGAGQRENAR